MKRHASSTKPAQLRRSAEAQLRKQKKHQRSKASVAKSEADPQRMLHELQVHQVELEMQNDELQKVREDMEAALEQYTDLYDFAPVGYFTLASDSTVQQANLTGASLVGIERSRLVGRCFDQLFPAGVRPAFRAFLQQVFAGQTKRSGDFDLLHPGQPSRSINIKAQRSFHEDSCRVAVVDITERKQAEDKVRVSEIRYRRLFETAHDGVLLLNPATRKITDANPFMTKLLAYPHDQLVGKELFEIGLLKDESASQEMFQKLKHDHEVRYEDLPLESKGGRHQEVEVVANLYQENGHAVIQCNIRDITARKDIEQKLSEKARLLDLSHDAIIVRDLEGRIRYWNHGAEELYGWTRAEALGKISHILLQTEFPIPLKQMIAELHRTDRWIGELVHTKRDGQRITVLARKTLDRDSRGKPASVLENITDITQRKQAEESLRESEERFRAFVTTSSDITYRMSPDWSEMRQLNGRNFIADMAKPSRNWLREYIHPHDQARVMAVINEAVRTKTVFQMEHQVRRVDGTLGWTFSRAVPLLDARGKIVEWFGAASDVTQRKQAEDALRESEERFRVMADAISQLAWIARPDGYIFWYNQRWYDYTGKTAKQMAGWGWKSVHDRGELPKVMTLWKASLATGRPFEMTFPLRGANGSFRSFLTRGIPLKNARGEVVQWFGTNTDVEDLKQAEAAQRRLEVMTASNRKLHEEIMRRQAVEVSLKQSERQKSQMLDQLRHLSRQVLHAQEEERKRLSRELHDVIAQTLTGINIQLTALKKEAALNLKGFDRSITRTQKLVEHSVNVVHEFARELRPAVLDDLGLIPALHSFVKIFSQRTRLHVALKAFAGVEQLDSNKRTVLFRVAQEALTNVARHAKASRVEVNIQKLRGGIGMKITDDGKSFNVERALPANGGKRLGLIGMRERVEMVGGKFTVASAPGQGTTIEAYLPLTKGKRV